ncbi:M24 family metallopeptidase [Bradyrhizobium sp. USDA 4504]
MTISKAPQIFPRSEYLRRIAAVKAEMAKQGVDALVVNNVRNITYLTGYLAKSAYVPQGLIVCTNRDEPMFILRHCDWAAGLHQAWMTRENITYYPESLIGIDGKDGYDAVIDFLIDLGPAARNVGLEFNDLTISQIEKFKKRLSKSDLVDCAKLVHWVRGVKSDLEIGIMREAAAIADAAVLRAAEVIRPGVREADVAAEIYGTIVRGVNGKPATDIASVFLCASPRTGTCHIRWTEDLIQKDSQINLELGCVRHGYVSAIMRTYIVGTPSDRLRKIHEAEVEGIETALAKVRPGATCHDVAKAFYDTIEKHGIKKDTRCGYSIGIEWLEPTASLQIGDMTVLKPNMTFHLMLGNWLDEEFGYVISETFRVTESGHETLTKAPRKLFEIH